MPNTPQCCRTCKHSRWSLTPTGRIKMHRYLEHPGKCVAPLPDIDHLLPQCVHTIRAERDFIYGSSGLLCPLYELNEGKPIGDGESNG